MDTTEKNFRVAESCGSCKYFDSLRASTGGKRKNGYCVLDATGPVPTTRILTWSIVKQYWNTPFSLDEFLLLAKKELRWRTEEQLQRDYIILVETVEYWKENRDRIHTTNQANLCDGYTRSNRRAGNAAGQLKREGIDWILQLDNQST
jgi:hypothetical protein